jgi:hypothetical protein
MTASPGWYTDPHDNAKLRWWDGQVWTSHEAPHPERKPVASPPARGVASTATAAPVPAKTPSRRPIKEPGARRRVRPLPLLLGAGAGVVLIVGVAIGAAGAAGTGHDRLEQVNVAGIAETLAPTPKPSPTSTPSPKITYTTATSTEAVPFNRVNQDDPNRDQGTSAIVVPGVEGQKTLTFRVTLKDGVEIAREKTTEQVTTLPVDEVTAVGTYVYVAPPPAPAPEAPAAPSGGGCDPNYSGQCVPISSDVDCAGGSGNGPAFVGGPVSVTGNDIYDLDRDGDGVACDA